MKIDFERLERLAAAGATANVIIEFLRTEDAKRQPKRARDKAAKRAKTGGDKRNGAKPSESERNEATMDDSPRARLFREGSGALQTLGLKEGRARSLIAQWLKLTHDDEQLVLAIILKARDLGAADAPGWILEALKQRTGNGRNGTRTLAAAGDDLIARAEEFEQQERDRTRNEPH